MQNSKIEWTDHTFNPWHGCQRVSPGCEHCYAETINHRYGFDNWGPAKTTQRRGMSKNYWRQPLRWNAQAEQDGRRAKVFCASMADVFEDHPQLDDWRADLFELIQLTPHLDWLLLTKRPENILAMVPIRWRFHGGAPANVWYGTSCEDQRCADERIPQLLKVPARVRFLSCEPLLGPVDLSAHLWCSDFVMTNGGAAFHTRVKREDIHWIICGGESGHGARPMHPDWARSLRDQCQAAGVAYHFKQWGEYAPVTWREAFETAKPSLTVGADGGSVYTQVGHLVGMRMPDDVCMERLGKARAGRLLDGRTWDEFPEVRR